MKNLITGLLATSACLSLSAAQQQKTSSVQTQTMMDPNPSARWGTNSATNFFLSGEAVWLKPLFSNFTSINQTSSPTTTHFKFFENKFAPGVRAAAGVNTPYDGWDLQAIYFGLNYKHNNSYYNWALPVNGSNSAVFYYNQGDLDLGRMYKVSKRLKMRPHFGVRALWLTQKNTYNLLETSNDNTNTFRLKSTLVGAEGGIDTNWMLSKEFCVYANLGFTTLVNSQNLSFVSKDNVTSTVNEQYKSNYGSTIVNGLDFMIGLRWDKKLADGDYHLGINVGYEHHSLINVNSNAVYQVFQNAFSRNYTDADFTMQGIALGARFDF